MDRTIEVRKSSENYLNKLNINDLPRDGRTIEELIKQRLENASKGSRASDKNLDLEKMKILFNNKSETKKEIEYFKEYKLNTLPNIKILVKEIANHGEIEEDELENLIKNRKLSASRVLIREEILKHYKIFNFKTELGLNNIGNFMLICNLNNKIYAESKLKYFESNLNNAIIKDWDFDMFYFYSKKFNDGDKKTFSINSNLNDIKDRHKEVDSHIRTYDTQGKLEKYNLVREIKDELNNIILDKDKFEDYKKITKLTFLSRLFDEYLIYSFDKNQFDKLVNKGFEATNNRNLSEFFVRYLYSQKKITVSLPDERKNVEFCSTCHNSYNSKDNPDKCPNCNHSFTEECVFCGDKYKGSICLKCKLSNKDYEKYKEILIEAENNLKKNNYNNALRILESYNKEILAKLKYRKKDLNYNILFEKADFYNGLEELESMLRFKNVDTNEINKKLSTFKINKKIILDRNKNFSDELLKFEKKLTNYKNAINCPKCNELIFNTEAQECTNNKCKLKFKEICWNCHGKIDRLSNISCECKTSNSIKESFINEINQLEKNVELSRIGDFSVPLIISEFKNLQNNYKSFNRPKTVVEKSIFELSNKIILLEKEHIARENLINKYLEEVNELYQKNYINKATLKIGEFIKKFPAYSKNPQVMHILSVDNKIKENLIKIKTPSIRNNERILIGLIDEIQSLSADCFEIEEIIRNLDVKPATNSLVEINDSEVRVTFDPSSSFDVTYTVVGKENRVPSSIKDGTIIEDKTKRTQFKDIIPSSIKYYYNIYTERFGTTSEPLTIGPLIVFPNIRKNSIKQIIENNIIKFSFDWPINAIEINISTKELSTNSNKISKINVNSDNNQVFEDHNVIVGKQYLYEFQAKYVYEGMVKYSDKISQVFTPTVIPDQPKLIDVERVSDFIFRSKLNKLETSQMHFYKSQKPVEIDIFKTYTNDEFSKIVSDYSLSLLNVKQVEEYVHFEIGNEELYYITMVSKKSDFSKISKSLIVNNKKGIKNLETKLIDNTLYIQFDFIGETKNLYIFSDSTRYLNNVDLKEEYIVVKNNGKRINQAVELKNNQSFITLFTEQENVFSDPITLNKVYENYNDNVKIYLHEEKLTKKNLKIQVSNNEYDNFEEITIIFYNRKNIKTYEASIKNIKLKYNRKEANYYTKLSFKLDKNIIIDHYESFITINNGKVKLIQLGGKK